MNDALVEARNLSVQFRSGLGKTLEVVSNVSFTIRKGETLGLVGESGCGKSTTALAVMQLLTPCSGRILFQGEDLARISKDRLKQLRPKFQMVFQDSVSSLNPRRKIIDTIAAPLEVTGNAKKQERVDLSLSMARSVGIDPSLCYRRPFELSGGQCQRVQIARALIPNPKLLVCDEPVSSLDVSIQAQILNLLEELRVKHNLTMLFISHDLSVIKNVSDTIAVMYFGRICEQAQSDTFFRRNCHPYTRLLLSAVPGPVSGKTSESSYQTRMNLGKINKLPIAMPSRKRMGGCGFFSHCPCARELCAVEMPHFKEIETDHKVACHFPL
jgi:peptide/nickel transport system ATP-binding protein